jgi:hypothetical protein
MHRSKVLWVVVIVLGVLTAAAVSYQYGRFTEWTAGGRSFAYTQAVLAVGHYKAYERIESFLALKCYDAALKEASELKNLQITLAYENLRASDNDAELVEYIRTRDPNLLEAISSGRVPELKSYTTTCP